MERGLAEILEERERGMRLPALIRPVVRSAEQEVERGESGGEAISPFSLSPHEQPVSLLM